MMCDHAKQRTTFGVRLADRQAIQWWIADAAIAIHACELMALDAAVKQDAGRDVRTEASMIKVFATEMASRVIDHAMQAFGAMGMTKEMPLQLMAQKVRTMRVYEGPTRCTPCMVVALPAVGSGTMSPERGSGAGAAIASLFVCYEGAMSGRSFSR